MSSELSIDLPSADHGTMSPGDFNFADYSTYTSPTIPSFPDSLGNLQPIHPNPQSAYPTPVSHHQPVQQPGYVPPTPQLGAGVVVGTKRRTESTSSASGVHGGRSLSFEEQSRLAAEEDKRKRNTAASARFRIKKKQREQALEKSAKEMTEKVTQLEGRIQALETENKWLKGLVTDKHGGSKEDILKLLREFSAQAAKVSQDAAAAKADRAEAERARDEHSINMDSSICVSTSSLSSDESVDSNKRRRKD